MDDHALRELIRQVTTGALSRRRFVQTMIGLGLTAPMAARMQDLTPRYRHVVAPSTNRRHP